MVRCSSLSVAPEFFGKSKKTDFVSSFGISHVLYVMFMIIVNLLIPKSPRLINSSAEISSTVVLFNFIFLGASFTSDFKISGPLVGFFVVGF